VSAFLSHMMDSASTACHVCSRALCLCNWKLKFTFLHLSGLASEFDKYYCSFFLAFSAVGLGITLSQEFLEV